MFLEKPDITDVFWGLCGSFLSVSYGADKSANRFQNTVYEFERERVSKTRVDKKGTMKQNKLKKLNSTNI